MVACFMIRSVAKEFVHGGHLLALGTVSIAAFSALLTSKTPAVDLLLMAYLFSYGAYSMNRSAEMDQDLLSNPDRTEYLQRRRKYLPAITLFCFVLGYILALLRNLTFFVALLVPLVLSLTYSIGSKKLVWLMGAKRLKDKLLMKNVVVSFGWSLVPILVGLYYQELRVVLFLLVPFIFLRLFVNTVFFDTRDIVGDSLNGVRTLPSVFGLYKSHAVMNLVDFLSAAYISFLIVFAALPIYSAIMLVLPFYSIVYRWFGLKNQARLDFLCDVVGDGEYVLWGALLFIGRIFI